MKFISFGSGSCGNCYYLSEDGFGLIIDMGLSLRSLRKHMRDYGVSLASVQAIFITHDHTDHVKGVGALAIETKAPVYATATIHDNIGRNPYVQKKIPETQRCMFQIGDTLEAGPFRIATCRVPHDTVDNCGYEISTDRTSLTLMTDMGRVTEDMAAFIARARNLVLEANYDEAMLQSGSYPQYLKKRISSGHGHISNRQTAEALVRHLCPGTERIWLCHLSEENNHPELARKTVAAELEKLPFAPELHVLKRALPTGIFEL